MAHLSSKPTASKPASGVSFYTPAQEPPAGSALDQPSKTEVPTLFQPLQIRGVTLINRFVVSPMCQYSADDGHLTCVLSRSTQSLLVESLAPINHMVAF